MLLMRGAHEQAAGRARGPSLLQRVYRAFDRRFERVRAAPTRSLLVGAAREPRRVRVALPRLLRAVVRALSRARPRLLPEVDAGQIRLHMRAPTGTRIEETARLADEVEAAIRELIPKDQLETILDNLGVPNSGINLSYSNAGTIGTLDGEILLSLREGPPADRGVRVAAARRAAEALPRASSSSSSPPTSSRRSSTSACRRRSTCSSAAPTWRQNAALAAELVKSIRKIPGRGRCARAPAVRQPGGRPADGPHAAAAVGPVRVQRRAERAGRRCPAARRRRRRSGSTRRTAWSTTSRCRRRSTRSTRSTRCSTCRSPARAARRPAAQHAAARQPRRGDAGAPAGGGLALQHHARRRRLRQRAGHRPCERRGAGAEDWSTRSGRSCRAAARSRCAARSQTMQSSFIGLGVGLAMAIVLVYLLIVVNFQSWIDAAIIIAALPAALAGIAWMLFITGTTLERAGADRRDHDDGRRDREQHPARRVRARAAGRRACRRCRPRSKPARRASGRC